LTVAACDPTTEYVYVTPDVPPSEREAKTYRDLALLATEHLNSARQANADKAAVKGILEGTAQ
jgi:hypothetical protein